MLRKASLLAASILVVVSCLPGHSQDSPSPSLGDLARQAQAQKDKNHAPAAKVLTNDDLPSASGLGSLGLGNIGNSKSGGKPSSVVPSAASASEDLDQAESFLTKLDSLDRPTLVKFILQDADHDFPGRIQWGKKLFAAKQIYVSHGRAVIQRAKQLAASAQSIQGNPGPDDPRVKDLQNKLQEMTQDSERTGAAFQAVVLEGRDLATQSSSH